jgi:hypothetical protein
VVVEVVTVVVFVVVPPELVFDDVDVVDVVDVVVFIGIGHRDRPEAQLLHVH